MSTPITVMLLDWDGPVANSRTWKMPYHVDPVAVQAINNLTDAGAFTVLTSTIRKNFDTVEECTEFMTDRGIRINWLTAPSDGAVLWRTDRNFTGMRHLEFVNWHVLQAIEEQFGKINFIAIDDEKYPVQVCTDYNVNQPWRIDSHDGMNYLALMELREIAKELRGETTNA